ncbi:nitroreductase family protein [Eubacterium oxidoreducens]|uniref:Nitroreductase n=1 Tax=Eubacterium oxidoreducens TaxID=1732 RepID=A0A1G6AAP0_EUBOX|nr:nitroreductase family protein [Eubacterium oxidoreducens]SDB05498.1 Nitroreductase [Eubacterium oxidoreducens]
MEFQKVAQTRRSIRKYDASKHVTKEQIEQMIQAAIYAPSWKNAQTARYYVAMSQEAMEDVKAALPDFNVKSIEGAGAIVVASFVKNRSGYERDGAATTELDHNEWGAYDLGMHNENLILKATDLGLGTLVMGIRDVKKLHEVLSIPEDEIVMSVIAVGHAGVDAQMPKRKSVDEIAKFY